MPFRLQWQVELLRLFARPFCEFAMTALLDVIQPWLDTDDDGHVAELMAQVEWLGQKLYQDYEPYDYESFDERVGAWLEQVADQADRQSLFNLLYHVFFVGRREFEALCRAAFDGATMRWLVDQTKARIDSPELPDLLKAELKKTWFCPVTDSMRINAFLKVNQLEGQSQRPDWRSLGKFADVEKVKAYMDSVDLQRIVLLEDFVGSGTQIKAAVEFAAFVSQDIPVLVAPLICCPKGVEVGAKLAADLSNVTFAPVLEIERALLLEEAPKDGEPSVFGEIRSLTSRVRDRFDPANVREPFGFKGTGALIVMYSNCPNNTIALLHNESAAWKALFPRIQRVWP